MSVNEISDIMYEVFYLALSLGGPILISAMVVGVIISIFQAATQINEQSLSFVPKLVIIAVVLLLNGNYMLESLSDFTRSIFAIIATG